MRTELTNRYGKMEIVDDLDNNDYRKLVGTKARWV